MDQAQTTNATDEKDEQKKPPRLFYIHNTCRSRHNRTLRAQAAEHGGMKQYIGGEHRLVRGRPLVMTEEQIMKHLPELERKKSQGLVDVKLPDGRSIDLKTGKPVVLAPPLAPLPHPLADSIQNDKPAGNYRPQIAGGIAPSMSGDDPSKIPELVTNATLHDDDDEEDDALPNAIKSPTPQQPRSGGKKSRR